MRTLSSAQRARVAARAFFVLSAAVALTLFSAAVCVADDIVQVEEDWQLVVSDPDQLTVSPQVTCTTSPVGNVNSQYAVFDLNLRNLPSYEAGGIQLQLWNGDSPVGAVRTNTGVVLQNGGETVTWTQRVSLADGQLAFAVVDGDSQTWGHFGDGNSVALTQSTELENLNGYNSAVSVANSGVGFGANRVTSLTLVGVRVYSAAGLVGQDTTPHVVYAAP